MVRYEVNNYEFIIPNRILARNSCCIIKMHIYRIQFRKSLGMGFIIRNAT